MYVSIKRALATAAIGLFVLLVAGMPAPAAASDRDCGDFSTQRAAQIFFLKHGGPRRDPHRLDADHDGIACESNPCPCYRKRRLPRLTADFAIGYAYAYRTTKSAGDGRAR